MAVLPSGTVTFLFTDLEGSSRLWDEHPEAMRTALARHDEILRKEIAQHDGCVVKTTGDGVHAVFATAHEGVAAAVAAQSAIADGDFGELTPVALVALGRLEAAGVILGHYDAVASSMPGPPWSLAMVDSARDALIASLGTDECAALFERGAALVPGEVATYLHTAINEALDDM